MDPTTLVMPGAQSLVTAILTDGWAQVRDTLANLWTRHRSVAALDNPAALASSRQEWDSARGQSLALPNHGTDEERRDRMQAFWAGYLAGQLAARPDLSNALGELPRLLGPDRRIDQADSVTNTISGSVFGTALQARDIRGDIHL